MIRLHLFPRVNGWQPSPPCAKVETYFVLTGTPYERAESWDIQRAPKQKFPFSAKRATPQTRVMRLAQCCECYPNMGVLDLSALGHTPV